MGFTSKKSVYSTIIFLAFSLLSLSTHAQYKFKADVYVGSGLSKFSQASRALQANIGIQVYLPARFLLEKEFNFSHQNIHFPSQTEDYSFKTITFLAGLHFKFVEWKGIHFSAGGGLSVNFFDQHRLDETHGTNPYRIKETLIGAYVRASSSFHLSSKWSVGTKFTQNTLYESSSQSYDVFVKYHLTYD